MFATQLFLVLFTCSFIPFQPATATTDSLCPSSLSQRSCRLCGNLFSELQPTDCCGDPVLGALCQSFLSSLSANDKRYFVGKRNGAAAAHGRLTLGKKNRNTFLGKRFEEATYGADDEEMRDALSEGGAMDGLMTSSLGGAGKRQRNNFLGKRVARSAERVTSRDDGRISRLIKQFVDKLAAELTEERGPSGNDGTVPDAMELLGKEWATDKDQLERAQRAKNTFLG